MSYGNIIVTVKCKIQLVEVIVFTQATVVKTTEAAASVASNVATAMVVDSLTGNVLIRNSQATKDPHSMKKQS